MSQKSFLDNKKSRKNFPYVARGGGSTNIWKIPYVLLFLFLKASLTIIKVISISALSTKEEINKYQLDNNQQ